MLIPNDKPPDRDESMQYSITELASGASLKTRTLDDQQRRFENFRDRLAGKSVCDYGAGFGGFVRLAAQVAQRCAGVELRAHCHAHAAENFPSIPFVTNIEVPHAKDFLIQSVQIPEFRDFTFWSEHLVLHTRETLQGLLEAAGFSDVRVWHEQRYGFTNHLNWFVNRKPGGHDALRELEDQTLEVQYREARERDGTSDTLMAEARA